MSSDLAERYKVALDLIERGATEVEISKDHLVVRKISAGNGEDRTVPQTNVQVSVVTSASAQSVASVQLTLRDIRDDLVRRKPDDAPEIEAQFDDLENELSQERPSKRQLRRFLKWAADLDWPTYVKLALGIFKAVGAAA